MTLDRRHAFARSLIHDAGLLALSYYDRRFDLTPEAKGPNDLVSIADREVERLIRARLSAEFPGDGFLGEESGGHAEESCWVVDPIDGTKNFLRGVPIWGVSIAYAVRAMPVLGLVHLPCLGLTFSARSGRGAYCGERRVRVTQPDGLSHATVSLGQKASGAIGAGGDLLGTMARQGGNLRSFGACIADLAFLADGAIDGFYHPHVQAWDYYAGLLMVEEAGGRSNAPYSPEALVEGSPVLAAAPGLYDQLAAIVLERARPTVAQV